MKTYFDGILEFDNDEELEDVIEKLSYDTAVKLLYTILSHAMISGKYDLDESFIVFKCFNKIQKNENKKK